MRRHGPIVGWPTWVGVVCEDLERQRGFYRDVLGLPELGGGEDWIWFDMGWPRLFELLALDRSRPQYDERRFQLAFSTADIYAVREELLNRSVEPVTDIEGGPESHEYWCYFRDAEGFLFEVVQSVGGRVAVEGNGSRADRGMAGVRGCGGG